MGRKQKAQGNDGENDQPKEGDKHYWTKVVVTGIAATIFGGIILWYLTLYITSHWMTSKEELALVQTFNQTFDNKKTRAESYPILKSIPNKEIQIDQTQNVIARLINEIIIQSSYSGAKYVFRADTPEYDDLIGAFGGLHKLKNKSAINMFNSYVNHRPNKYKKYTSDSEYFNLLRSVGNDIPPLREHLSQEAQKRLNVSAYDNSTSAGRRMLNHILE
jgi:hypothetical protein